MTDSPVEYAHMQSYYYHPTPGHPPGILPDPYDRTIRISNSLFLITQMWPNKDQIHRFSLCICITPPHRLYSVYIRLSTLYTKLTVLVSSFRERNAWEDRRSLSNIDFELKFCDCVLLVLGPVVCIRNEINRNAPTPVPEFLAYNRPCGTRFEYTINPSGG